MIRNPEFRRQLWLHPPHLWALAITPLFGLICLLVFLSSAGDADRWIYLVVTAQCLSVGAVLAGAIAAGHAFEKEQQERTWDWQRLSALDAFELGWGKMIGASASTWYTLALAQSVAWFAYFNVPDHQLPGWALGQMLGATVLLVVLGLALQALSICMLALVSSNLPGGTKRQSGSVVSVIILLALINPFSSVISSPDLPVQWYGATRSALEIGIWVAIAMLAWCLILMEHAMRASLQARTRPWVLPMLMVFAITSAVGFIQVEEARLLAPGRAAAAAGLALLTLYVGLAVGRYDAIALRRFLLAWRDRRVADLARATPAWLWALLLFLPAAAATMLLGARLEANDFSIWTPHLTVVVLRDVAIWIFLVAHPRIVRADAVAFLSYALLHLGLPMLFVFMDMNWVWGMLSFSLEPSPLHTLAVAASTCALLLAARTHWQRRMAGLLAH